VCLLPYKVNERTRNISSLKLYEYLACGKPVVATDIPAAREAQDCVRIADRDDFVVVVEKALLDDELTAGRRRRLAAANTWDDRVERISAIIAQLLQGHQSKS
jgi:glycosyltransferase involved in cell wall biosynthesis